MCQRKTESSILTGSKPQCLVRLQVIYVLTEFFFEEALQHQTQENIHTGNFTESIRKHLEKEVTICPPVLTQFK